MKYILFEKSAVEELISYRYLQAAEYAQGRNFARFLRGEDDQLELLPTVCLKKSKEGCFFVGKEISKTFFVVDVEKSRIFDNITIEETIQVFQKLFRFAVRYWNKQGFTTSEWILSESNKAVIFPFPYSRKSSFRVVIQRDPDSERMSVRGMRQLFLVYKSGNEGAPNHIENPIMSNFRAATEEYGSVLAECRIEIESRQHIEEPTTRRPLEIHEIYGIVDGGNPYMPYSKWDKILTDSQRDFIYKLYDGPMRLEGPAGTGKTLTLILKSIYLLLESEKRQEECRIIFFAHSKATQLSIRNIFDSISEGKWAEQYYGRAQSILITTLHEFCIDKILVSNISESEVLERDALDSKQLQYFAVGEAYDMIMESFYKTYKPLLSDELIKFIEENDKNRAAICSLLQHEFSVMIKGKASGELEKYKKLTPLESGLSARTENDKLFVYKIFSEYQRHFEQMQQYDTDDIVLTAIGHLDSPVWRRRRKREGFDYIFIDETHLFNPNETILFHHLTKGPQTLPIIFSIDISQAIGDQGSNSDDFLESYKKANKIYNKEYELVFRCSQQITDLAMSITASGSNLFGHFRNPYKETISAFTAQEESISMFPEYALVNEDGMLAHALKYAEDMVNKMRCSPGDIAIVSFSENLLVELTKSMGSHKYIEIIRRGDLDAKNRALKEKAFILSMPEYIGGLEFHGVILIGVDGLHVPPMAGEDVSRKYLMFSAFNKLYVSITRAKYRVVLIGVKEHGLSPCLEYSIKEKTLKLVE